MKFSKADGPPEGNGQRTDEISKYQEGHASAASEKLKDSTELILDSALDYAIFTLDTNGLVTDWPAGARAVFGWTADEIVGRPVSLLFTPEDVVHEEMERELDTAARNGVVPDVRWHQHKDGSRMFIDGWTRAITDAQGQLRGFIKVGQDVTQRRQLEADLRDSEERFRVLSTSVPHLVFRSRDTGERTWSSLQWERYAGLSDSLSAGFGWLQAIHPDDTDPTLKAWAAAGTHEQFYAEHRIRRASDGQYRWHQTRALPLPATGRGEREWVGTSADVHELWQLQEKQRLLVAELQHRTRNLLGVVQAIMQQTIESSDSLLAFRDRFSEQLTALSRVQGLLSQTGREAILLGALIRMELAAVGAADAADVTVEGPDVTLPESAVQIVALAVHELATNARKYGALSKAGGTLRVTWRAGDGLLTLEWAEQGRAKSPPPIGKSGGFGRTLLEEALPAALGARTSLSIEDGSVYCRIEIPLG